MDTLIDVAAKIAELTVEPIATQVGYLFCYKNKLSKLDDQANELLAAKQRIDLQVDTERRNLREIYIDVQEWQKSVAKTSKEVKQLCEDPHGANLWCFPNLKSRYQHGREAKKMADTIVDLKRKGKFDGGVAYDPHFDRISNLPALSGSDGLKSRKSVKEKVVLSLKDPKVNKIGVYGIGGVGKTTLVQEIAKQVKHDKLFDVLLIVTISQTNLGGIQDDIAEQLGLRLEERTSTSGRTNRLCERIKKEKSILIILDDLQEKIDLDKLGIPSLDTWGKMNPEKVGVPLKEDYKGCKLLLTSRSKDILQMNDAQKNFELQVLNGEESWSLFEAMVGDVVKDDKFRKIATQVAQRCVGLPVLIVTVAKSLLYNEDIHYWKDTWKNLKTVDSGDMKETIFSVLEFNFNRLKDEVKKIFLLCGMHGTSIHVSDLLKYAIGLGIFKCINTIEDARHRLYRIISNLKASCLLVNVDAREKIIKMHDIVHEVVVSMASEYAFSKINAKFQDWPGKDILEKCTHIILLRCCIEKLPERLDCPYLTFLHIDSSDNRTLEIPNSFFERMGNLEALDLTGMTMSSLPMSLSSLTKLKTLCLDQCSLKDMTGIGALTNLEILSLIHSSVEEFPSGIEQLTKLRMLDMSRSGIGTTLPNILCKLTKIEELYMGNATIIGDVEGSTKQRRNANLGKLGDLTDLTILEIQIREASLLPKDIAFEKLERYKVVIGDEWEWSDSEETSRLLKVKLDTNIHWERGIKTLIKSVEDLHMDKISGISNVLFDLNGEGFPLLRHLHMQNNGEIQHIVTPMKRNQAHVLFPNLETMILNNLDSLVKICHSSVRDNSFGKLKVVKVRSCDQLVYLFSFSIVKAFSQLVEIEVSKCRSMKKIMCVESTDSGKTFHETIQFLPLRSLTLQHLPTIDYFCSHEAMSSLGTTENLLRVNISVPFFSAEVKFSNLETLKLSSVNLKKIWDDSSALYLVHNLANLTVEDCRGLKYLFSSSMVGRLSNLKRLEISNCDMMEEIIAAAAEEIIAVEEINRVAVREVIFPNLEAIIIKDMQNLKTIWHHILASNSLACLKTLKVKNCEKIEKIFPEYMNGAFAALETLKVKDCKLVQEIFQLGDNADDKPQLKYITLLGLPQLKQVWSRDPQGSHCFKSLQVVRVEDCGHLEYLFPFSIAEDLPQLEAIKIRNAEKMKEIVSNREETIDDPAEFVFNQLTSMELLNLPDLRGFFAGNHCLSCSSLKELHVFSCEKLKLFKTQGTCSQERLSDNNLHIIMQQPLFALEEVIENLESLFLNNEEASMILQSQVPWDRFCKLNILLVYKFNVTSPYWFLQNISSLKELFIVENYFKEIFPDERPRDENGEIEINTRLKKLTLYRLYKLEHLCKEECQLDPVLDGLEYLGVYECSSLKHLVPSLVTFNHLTDLEVVNCSGLIYLITSSTARSLVNLTTLKMINCDLVEKIVKEAGSERICEIAFRSLQVLVLESLPKLKMFCSSSICCLKLPVLEKLVIRQCARMESFSSSDTRTPFLREILTDEQDKKWFCEGGLNNTVNKMFQDMVAFRSAKHLELSKYSEFKDLWSSHVQLGIFGNLTNLVVHKCDFLSYVLLPLNLLQALSNLEELEVSECDSLRAVFDLTNMNERGMAAKVEDCDSVTEVVRLGVDGRQNVDDATRLKNLTILRLPKLKQIWSKDPQLSLRFKSLQVLRVEGCVDLEHLFPLSIAKNLPQLEAITLKDLEIMKEIVSNREETIDDSVKFEFGQLTSLVLWNLRDLREFFAGNHSLSCPSLKELDVSNCEKLKLFKRQGTCSQERLSDDNLHLTMQQPLFTLQEVIENLEYLSLNNEDASTIFELQVPWDRFRKLNFLRLYELEDTKATSPYWFLQNISSLETVVIQDMSFSMIFPNERPQDENGEIDIKTRLKILTLFKLYELEHLCKEECQLDPVLDLLEFLVVVECSNLKHLVPSSVTLNCLTYLNVRNCSGLIYLITSSTATSLAKLTTLTIRECDSVEEIVAEKGGESINEIAFNSLEVLELDNLSKLQMFCSSNCLLKLPWLVKLVIRRCPRMTSFSTREPSAPMLQKIVTDEEDGKWCWEGDLSTTVNKMFQDMVAFRTFNLLEFSKYPELKQLWYGQDGQKIFCNLKHLVVHKCTFLSNMIFPSNLLQLLYTLEELEVAECESLEAVFDVKALNDKAMESKAVSGLKKLTLSGLPNLKHIWNKEAAKIISFGNLQIVKVGKCPNLKYVFSPSLFLELCQLEELNIESCGVENIVGKEEGFEELKFYFPLLKIFSLIYLTQVNDFYPKRYTLECPSLKVLNVGQCEALQIFTFGQMDTQQPREVCVDLPIQQALFHIEKVSEDLEELSLNEKDARRIFDGNYEKKLFERTKILCLQYFQETPAKFLNDLIQKFPAITTLQIRCSSFETLFISNEFGPSSVGNTTQIKKLLLFQLEQLEHIWKDDDSVSHPLLQNLEVLSMLECSRIIRLAPPSTSFKNLTHLEVGDCNGLMYFMTTCTAKSLIHLRWLLVSNCGTLEEVVVTDDEGQSKEEITFESLKYLELNFLSYFKSFCSGKINTFLFPSLVTLKVIGCPKMQNFSSGVIIAPFLKLVEVENGKKRWKEDLNTTIKQLFIDKVKGEGAEGDCKESSSINLENNQTCQKSVSASRALSFDESKAHEIVNSGKQEMHKLPTSHTGIGTQKICEITETLDQTSQNTSKFTKVDAVIETREMHETIEGDFVEDAQSKFSCTNVQDAALGTQDETIQRHLVQVTQQGKLSPSIVLQDTDIGTHVTHESIEPFVQATQEKGIGTQKICEITEAMDQASQKTLKFTKVDAVIETREMHETTEGDFVQDSQNKFSYTIVQDAVNGNDEMNETIQTPYYEATESSSTHTSVQETAHGTQDETIQRHLVQATHHGELSPSIVLQDTDEPQDLQLHLSENLQVQATTSTMNDEEENTGTKEMHETIQRPLVQNAEDTLVLASVQDIATGIHMTHESIVKPLAHATQNAWDITIVQKKEELYDSDIHLSKNLFNQTITPTEADYRETVGTQETYKSKRRLLVPDAQNVSSPIMVYDTAVDPAPSQASEANSSSTTPIADVCSSFKELNRLLPYLEAGVKCHPKVLNWLNTEQRRVFASSIFSLFAEVTRIFRTTRRGRLTEGDRNYITKCCTVLEVVDFDASWLSYVYKCVDKCGDNAEDIKRKVEETKGQASSLEAQLESIKKELALLLDKASWLDDFIES